MTKQGWRELAQLVWAFLDQGSIYSSMLEIVWPEYCKCFPSDKNEEIDRLTGEERKRALAMRMKGVIDTRLISVHKLGLQREFLENPSKYTQGVCATLMREKRQRDNAAPVTRHICPNCGHRF